MVDLEKEKSKPVIFVMMVMVVAYFHITALHRMYTLNLLMGLCSLVRFQKILVQMETV